MKKKILLSTLALLLAISLVAVGCAKPAPAPAPAPTPAPAPEKEVFNWRMQTSLSPTIVYGAVVLPEMIERIKVASEGRLNIELYHIGELTGLLEMWEAVGQGVFELSETWPVYHAGLEPSLNVFSGLPYGPPSLQEHLYLFQVLGWEDLFNEVTARHGIHIINQYVVNPWGSLTSKVPIRTLDDFKGLKIRGYGMGLKTVELFGARGVSMPGAEIYTALATGVVDAAMWGVPSTNYSLKLHEVSSYWIDPPILSQIVKCNFMNLDAWNSLPDDLKQILTWAFFHASTMYPSYVVYEDAIAIKDMIDNWGFEFITLPPEDRQKMRDAGLSLWDEAAAADDYSARAVKILKDLMILKGYIK